jgi:uncharacterized protein (DUF2062 family)/2-polyprenyl-3-methyl-5-hydroxy-6-metoxy-1,4-benzoquinol methylase
MGRWSSKIRELAGRLWREHSSPSRLGAAVAVGIVVGCSPFFGLHFWIGLGLALLLRLNKVAVLLGSQISIPPLAPFLGFASVQLGALMLSGQMVELTVDDFSISNLPELLRHFLLNWVVGGLALGLALAALGFCLTAALVRRRRRRAAEADGEVQTWRDDLQRATERYAAAPRGHRTYASIKYRMDPLYLQVCELVGAAGRIVDLGTGLGMLPVLLAVRGQGERIIGVDWDEDKIRSGRLAAAGLPTVELVNADIREHEIGQADVVVLADVLHYWPLEVQQAILRRAASALDAGGRIIVRDTDREARSWLTRTLEAIAVRVGWNRGPGLAYRTEQELRLELESLGLTCRSSSASSSVHKGNVLIYGERDPRFRSSRPSGAPDVPELVS